MIQSNFHIRYTPQKKKESPPSKQIEHKTHLRFTGLASKALATNNLGDGKSINLMVGILGCLLFHGSKATGERSTTMHPVPQLNLWWQDRAIIVTNTTAKGSTTARGN